MAAGFRWAECLHRHGQDRRQAVRHNTSLDHIGNLTARTGIRRSSTLSPKSSLLNPFGNNSE